MCCLATDADPSGVHYLLKYSISTFFRFLTVSSWMCGHLYESISISLLGDAQAPVWTWNLFTLMHTPGSWPAIYVCPVVIARPSPVKLVSQKSGQACEVCFKMILMSGNKHINICDTQYQGWVQASLLLQEIPLYEQWANCFGGTDLLIWLRVFLS